MTTRRALPDFKALFENAPGLFLVLDPKLTIVAASDAYLEAVMLERKDLIGNRLFEVFPDEPSHQGSATLHALRESLLRVIDSRQPDAMTVQRYDLRTPNRGAGSNAGFVQRYWSPYNVPVMQRGKLKYLIHRVNDVTEAVLSMEQDAASRPALHVKEQVSAKQWEMVADFMLKETQTITALRQKEGEYQSIVNSIPLLAWTADATGYIYWYNDRWYEYTGKTPKEMEGWGWQSVHHPKTLPDVLQHWKLSIATGRPFTMEFPLRSASGEFRWFLTRVVPVRDKQNQITRWFGTNTDVDDIRKTQDRFRANQNLLRISEERLRLAQKAAKIGSWEFDIDQDEYIWSEEAAEILGRSHTLRRVAEKDFLSMMYVPADRENAIKAMHNAVSKKREYDISFRVQKAQGQFRWIAARGTPFFNQGQNLMIGVFIDITDARNAQPEALASGTSSR